ncbi:MAG: F0F1 ATP synthase subunit B [Gloeocapsa sp. DLM2.Bin57]|nr:MAG: F0F1 ATP synthase subunit B [Gloeocapsa sp. DLM2.Bin57]
MLIDGFTIFAQIVNFLILVALLKHFLYQPILKAMEQRESNIKNRVREASLQLENAENQALIYQKKQRELEAKKEAWLSDAQAEVREEKERLLQQVKEEVEEVKLVLSQQLEREKEAYLDNFQQQISQQVISITRQILKDLANRDLEEEIINVFRQGLTDKKLSLSEPIIIKTTFALTSEQQQKLLEVLAQNQVEFQTLPGLICGIELSNQSYQLTWNVEQYLQGLEQALKCKSYLA